MLLDPLKYSPGVDTILPRDRAFTEFFVLPGGCWSLELTDKLWLVCMLVRTPVQTPVCFQASQALIMVTYQNGQI